VAISITQNLVTGSRAIGTVYQNTTGFPMFVFVSGGSTASVPMVAVCDASSSPSLIVSWESVISSGFGVMVVFLVPQNYYYKVTGATSLGLWTESTINITNVMTQTDVSGSRALGTVYQNTSGKVIFVNMRGSVTAADSNVFGYSDINPSPTTLVGRHQNHNSGLFVRLFFPVLPGYYYKITTDLGCTLNSWIESAINNPLPMSQNVVTGSRAMSTKYQATASPLLVSACPQQGAPSDGTLFGDVQAPPGTYVLPQQIEESSRKNVSYAQMFYLVPLNYFYACDSDTGSTVIGVWVEWKLTPPSGLLPLYNFVVP
jgi:hypothetical protein